MPFASLPITAVLLCAPSAAGAAQPEGGRDAYARPEMLVEPADLRKSLDAGGTVVLDARKREEYEKARIPGARWVDAEAWAKEFGKGDDAAGWGKRIGALGIGPRDRVVVHDDALFRDAGRIWWILRYWGVEDAALLNGNWSGWKAAGLPVAEGAAPPPAPASFAAKARPKRLSTKKSVLDLLGSRKAQILDARSAAEYCGTDLHKNRRGGAIPGARNLEWTDLLDKKAQRFKGAAEMRRLLETAGIDPKKPVVTYCQSGGRAAVMTFALELLGSDDVSNYYGSWGEWGNADDTPVEKGEPKK